MFLESGMSLPKPHCNSTRAQAGRFDNSRLGLIRRSPGASVASESTYTLFVRLAAVIAINGPSKPVISERK